MSKIYRQYLILPWLLLTSACAWFGMAGLPTPLPPTAPAASPTSSMTVTATPLPPTGTFTPTAAFTDTPTATITLTPELPGIRYPETPVPVPLPYDYPEGQVRILLLGVDDRTEAYRADAIVILSINPRQGTASLLSIPPMLYVNIPEVGMERINSAIYFGGPGKVIDTIQYNLGVRVNKYLTIDFQNFTRVLESLGPIDVQVGEQLIDRCDLPQSVEGWCAFEPGLNSMDKDTVLWYVRDLAGGETARMRRSQETLLAVFNRLMEIQAPSRIGELYSAYYANVQTDLTMEDLIDLSQPAIALYVNRQIRTYSLSSVETAPATLPGGENVLLLDQNAAWKLIFRAVFQP